jgi:hypothetical protein
LGDVLVEDLVCSLNLYEVVAASETSQLGSSSRWDEIENGVYELWQYRSDLVLVEICPNESYSTVNVVTNASRTDESFVVVCSRYSSNWESISLMPVWHGNGILVDAI